MSLIASFPSKTAAYQKINMIDELFGEKNLEESYDALSLQDLADIFYQIAQKLQEIHEDKAAHRDLTGKMYSSKMAVREKR